MNKRTGVAAMLMAVLAAVLMTGEAMAQINGVLRTSTVNGRYFTDNSGRAVYLTGTHTWANLVDGWLTEGKNDPTPPAFDFSGYLDYLQANNHNHIRLWTQHMTKTDFSAEGTGIYYATPSPWQRTGPGTANDGGLKFDLTKYNQTYFDRLRSRCIAARDRGMYVTVMLFEGYSLRRKKGTLGWNYDPFHQNNNINSINGDPNGDTYGSESHTLQVAAITTLQEAYIRKVVDAVNDLDNILYEISNEENNRMGGTTARDWQWAMMSYIRTYEAGKAKQHPVVISCIYNNDGTDNMGSTANNSWLTGSTAEAIAPWGPANASAEPKLNDNPPATTGSKVYFADTDHIFGVGGGSDWVWKVFTRGYNPIYMDGWGNPDYSNPLRSEANAAMGYTLTYANKMDLINMTPQNTKASTGYCLAKTGGEYLAYQPGTGAFTVTLTAASYTYEWFNPSSGAVASSGSITGTGSAQTVTPPFSGPAVLYCKVTAANQVATPSVSPDGGQFSDAVSVTMTCATSGAEIRYTTNGTEPTSSSTLYSGALNLTSSTTIKAAAFKSGMTASNTKTAVFTKLASGGGVLIDDDFDNGVLTTNPNGTGSGWTPATFNSGNAPTESGGAFEGSMGTVNGISGIIGKDNFTVWDADGITATWVIKDITVQTPHAYSSYLAYCAEMGIVSANASKTGSEWIMSEVNTKGGLYVSVGKKDNTNAVEMWVLISNKNVGTASTGWIRLPVAVGSKLGRRWTATFPLTITVRMTSTGWSVNANQTGEGAIPIEGNWSSSLISGTVNASITNEFSNGAFLWTAGRNHGIVNPPPASYTPNSGRMERITVTRSTSTPTTVSTPSISPDGGTFETSQPVTLSCATSGAEIRYTTNGSDPTASSTLYSSAFTLTTSATVKARAFKSGLTQSSVAGASFTKSVTTQTPYHGSAFGIPCKIEAEDFDLGGEGVAYHDLTTANQGGVYRTAEGVDIEALAGGGYHLGFVSAGEWTEYMVNVATAGDYDIQARVANAGAGGSIHIEFDGVNKTGSISIPNTGAWTSYQLTAASTVTLSAGPQVMRVCYDVASSAAGSGVANVDYIDITSESVLPAVATPSISPDGGSFDDSVLVSISCATSGASIRYTTDNSTPSGSSALYSTSFFLKASGTVKAKAFKADMTDSPTAAAVFTQTASGQAPFGGTAFAIPCKVEAEDFDFGGEGIAYHDLTVANQGGVYRTTEAVDVESLVAGGFILGFVGAGEWTEYTVNVAVAGNYSIRAMVANAGAGGKMHIEFDGVNKTGNIDVPNTGAWTAYQLTSAATVALDAGQQVMRIVFDQASSAPGSGVANVDYVDIAAVSSVGGMPSGAAGPAPVAISPNPMRDRAVFALPGVNGTDLRVDIYNRNGGTVKTIRASGGSYGWDGTDDSGARVKPGVYMCTVTGGGRQETGRIIVLP